MKKKEMGNRISQIIIHVSTIKIKSSCIWQEDTTGKGSNFALSSFRGVRNWDNLDVGVRGCQTFPKVKNKIQF